MCNPNCNPDDILDTPVCRHCGQPLRVRPQVTHYEKDGKVIIHREYNFIDCQDTACPLYMQTFDDTTYADKDLTPYLPNDEDTERITAVQS